MVYDVMIRSPHQQRALTYTWQRNGRDLKCHPFALFYPPSDNSLKTICEVSPSKTLVMFATTLKAMNPRWMKKPKDLEDLLFESLQKSEASEPCTYTFRLFFLWGLCLCGKHNTSRSPYLLPYSKLSFLWNSLITYSSLQPKALWVGLPGAKKGHVHGRTEKMCPWSYQNIWRRVFVTIKILTETNKAAQSPSLFQDSWAFSRAFTIGIAASSITFWRAEHKAERQGQLD